MARSTCWINVCCGLEVTCGYVVGKRDLDYTNRGLADSAHPDLADCEQMLVGIQLFDVW